MDNTYISNTSGKRKSIRDMGKFNLIRAIKLIESGKHKHYTKEGYMLDRLKDQLRIVNKREKVKSPTPPVVVPAKAPGVFKVKKVPTPVNVPLLTLQEVLLPKVAGPYDNVSDPPKIEDEKEAVDGLTFKFESE